MAFLVFRTLKVLLYYTDGSCTAVEDLNSIIHIHSIQEQFGVRSCPRTLRNADRKSGGSNHSFDDWWTTALVTTNSNILDVFAVKLYNPAQPEPLHPYVCLNVLGSERSFDTLDTKQM